MPTRYNFEKRDTPQEVRNIIMGGRIGIIANAIAERLNIEPMRALEMFYESDTCARLHDEKTGLYLLSDLCIVEDYLSEINDRRTKL